ncbi:MAG: hypothetical protein QNJ05_15490 [Woeseiaceae bacterium]|nr:hypothetical protein [Woeseiaceae bacterium]
MPIEMAREKGGSVLAFTGRGVVTGSEILEMLEGVYATDFAASDQLWDFTGADRVDVATDEIRRMEALDREVVSRDVSFRVAVAASQDLAFGLSRMWATFVDDIQIETHVARTIKEAREWLDSAKQ